jgi:hypothetical protein
MGTIDTKTSEKMVRSLNCYKYNFAVSNEHEVALMRNTRNVYNE